MNHQTALASEKGYHVIAHKCRSPMFVVRKSMVTNRHPKYKREIFAFPLVEKREFKRLKDEELSILHDCGRSMVQVSTTHTRYLFYMSSVTCL